MRGEGAKKSENFADITSGSSRIVHGITDNPEGHGLQDTNHEVAETYHVMVLRKSDGDVEGDHGDAEPEYDLPSSQQRARDKAEDHGPDAVPHAHEGRLKTSI